MDVGMQLGGGSYALRGLGLSVFSLTDKPKPTLKSPLTPLQRYVGLAEGLLAGAAPAHDACARVVVLRLGTTTPAPLHAVRGRRGS